MSIIIIIIIDQAIFFFFLGGGKKSPADRRLIYRRSKITSTKSNPNPQLLFCDT